MILTNLLPQLRSCYRVDCTTPFSFAMRPGKGFLRNFCGLIKTDTIRVITTAFRRMSRKISLFQKLDSMRKGDGHFNIRGLKLLGGPTRRRDNIRRDSLSSSVKWRQMLLSLSKRFLVLHL